MYVNPKTVFLFGSFILIRDEFVGTQNKWTPSGNDKVENLNPIVEFRTSAQPTLD
jgi:hypothetical protein